ncbi:type ISP restriction/modification enzyme [Faecalibacter bovis]|uniref:site-specific DNA-methyltransferase (adenine-specific) n=1 Tax=Faecalibacter bovis TaxID=2898187 RepID=A0ABX7XA73_9FLAO|nr:type ISP restriction/modification enzyme [Faecalibacter bovis]QTV04784.1 N-6 DNA methylase [Faecalibacter bovis]
MTIQNYIENLNRQYQTGNAREHSYRGDLQNLLKAILPEDILVTNEPARVTCGAPDYVITKGKANIPVGYIEAKDIGVKLDSKSLKEQFDRYRNGLSNLIITDYMLFDFYRDGEKTTSIAIAELIDSKIVAKPENFDAFTSLIKNFAETISQTIKSPQRLAELLAGKARLMADVIEKSLNDDDEHERLSELKNQMETFKRMLIHDINNKSFADIYAQTIAYGMFAARYNDPTLETFSRLEAANLIPKSNPFLRKLFQDIAGFDLDDRLVWIVEELVSIFLATDVAKIMKNFGKSTKMEDPIIHFYETFLSEYDSKLRKARGVWYTPQPVVNFIVRAVDDILKDEFGLSRGLADTSKTKIKVNTQNPDKRSATGYKQEEREIHRVQILDPATGTGTFLAETVKHIHSKFKGMEGMWPKYVKEDLIPRLNGFELLMASYAMAHLKMDMLLQETGYKSTDDQRFRIFLTNSLEEAHPDSGTLFSSWLSDESAQANAVKRDTPVMCVIGNPPYAVSSTNKNDWIQDLISDYKKNLNERKINLDDDYIKFIRYGQHYIDKNGSGVLAYISNNSFLDGITHRQMRKHLLESFDKIYILDLHGNSRKLETSPDGSIDQNVFDIMAGVSINIFVKTGKKKKNELGQVYNYDLYGKRDFKYKTLTENDLSSLNYSSIECNSPYYFFVPKNFESANQYDLGFKIDELLPFNNSGFETAKDKFLIKFNKTDIKSLKEDIENFSSEEISSKYNLKITKANEVKSDIENAYTIESLYRPFDKRYTLISTNSKGVMFRPRFDTVKHLLKENVALLCCKRQTSFDFQHAFITKSAVERCSVSLQTGEVSYAFPLYLYPETNGQQTIDQTTERQPNLNTEIVNQIASKIGLTFTNEKETTEGTFAPIDLLDYIYAVLHSPKYRETYKEFLKIDFPRVPYPTDQKQFWDLVALGKQIREIHLLESPKVEDFISSYPVEGTNIVGKPKYAEGKVYINDTQYFDNVPEVAWNFYIGGYQPAQKWLKDRKDIELGFEDIMHYNKIIVALTETDRLMKEIDKIEIIEQNEK